METTPIPAPAPAAAPAAPAAPDYVPPVPPPAAPAPAAPQYAAGGFLKQFDWVEIGFMILGAYALFNIIYYYRRKTVEDRKQRQATTVQMAQTGMRKVA